MWLSAMKRLPKKVGAVTLRYDKMTSTPTLRGHVITLPHPDSRDAEFFFLKRKTQFLYWLANHTVARPSELWFGGVNNNVPFFKKVDSALIRIFRHNAEDEFYSKMGLLS